MNSSKPYSLGSTERLKSRKQIDSLFENGKKITVFPIRLIYRLEIGRSGIKAGFTVSSKNFPRAVDRNRIKRLSRESYRLQKKELESVVLKNESTLHLFFIFTGRELVPYVEMVGPMKQVLDKMVRRLNENHISNT
jgi:ribonuclease P protein component